MINASSILTSVGQYAPRLDTQLWRYPKFVHQESLRHRLLYILDQLDFSFDFSWSVSSARAIPFSRNIDEVMSDHRAAPVSWGSERRGMVPGDELNDTDKTIYWTDVMRHIGTIDSIAPEWITERLLDMSSGKLFPSDYGAVGRITFRWRASGTLRILYSSLNMTERALLKD